jgi:hypothetical protein
MDDIKSVQTCLLETERNGLAAYDVQQGAFDSMKSTRKRMIRLTNSLISQLFSLLLFPRLFIG